MKTILALLALTASAFAQAPTPITAAAVPTTVTAPIPVGLRVGIAAAYNSAVAAEYAALPPAQQASYTPPTVQAYVLARVGDVFRSYTKQVHDNDLSAARPADKWGDLTQAQRDQIKAILSTVP